MSHSVGVLRGVGINKHSRHESLSAPGTQRHHANLYKGSRGWVLTEQYRYSGFQAVILCLSRDWTRGSTRNRTLRRRKTMWIPEFNSEGIRNFVHPPPTRDTDSQPNSWFKMDASLLQPCATETRQMFW